MNSRLALTTKVVWLLMANGILIFTLHLYDGTPATRDAELILLYGMLILSFPASQIVLLILGAIGYLVELCGGKISVPINYLTLVVDWLVFLIVGYLQWFVLLPWLWRKLKTSRVSNARKVDSS